MLLKYMYIVMSNLKSWCIRNHYHLKHLYHFRFVLNISIGGILKQLLSASQQLRKKRRRGEMVDGTRECSMCQCLSDFVCKHTNKSNSLFAKNVVLENLSLWIYNMSNGEQRTVQTSFFFSHLLVQLLSIQMAVNRNIPCNGDKNTQQSRRMLLLVGDNKFVVIHGKCLQKKRERKKARFHVFYFIFSFPFSIIIHSRLH